MKAAEFIHKKLPRFTKPRFYYIYEQLLYTTISEMEKSKKTKKIKKKVFTMKEPYISYWPNIIQAFKSKDNRFNNSHYNTSILMTSYIKLYIKRNIIPKLFPISFHLKRSIEYIVRIHLKLCKHEMEHKHLPHYDSKDTIAYADEEEAELKRKNNIINLFIGDFDLKKFLENEQKIKMKKGEYCNTFIFANHNKETPQKKKIITLGKLFSPQKHKKLLHKQQQQQQPHLYCNTNRNKIHSNSNTIKQLRYYTINTSGHHRNQSKVSKKCYYNNSSTNNNNKDNSNYVVNSKENVSNEFETIVPNRKNYHSHQCSEEIQHHYKINSNSKKLKPLLSNSNSNCYNKNNYSARPQTQRGVLYRKGSVYDRKKQLLFPKVDSLGNCTLKDYNYNSVVSPYKTKRILKTENFFSKKDLYY